MRSDKPNTPKRRTRQKGDVSLSNQAVAPKDPKRIKVKRPLWGRILLILMLVFFLLVIVGATGAIAYFKLLEATFDVEAALENGDIPRLGKESMYTRSSIYVQNEDGEWVRHRELSGGNCIWYDYDKIPQYMKDAVVAIEDERYWEHEGVDWKRTTGAMINLVLNRAFNMGSTEYGGSTITQQLIKVTTQNTDHSINRKINEILAASAMESQVYSKEQILEGYLNNVPLTGDLIGVGVGARSYFDKELPELTLAECAVLASITNNPSIYDPFNHPENVRQRQQLVLGKMYELGFINQDEYLNALNQELIYKTSTVEEELMDYYDDLLIEDVIQALMERKGLARDRATYLVYYGGLSIYSAENVELQAEMEALYADESNYPEHLQDDEEDPQTCFFATDYTGKVMVTIGGRGEKTSNRVLNRSTHSMRSPGSSMKPIASYGPAIDQNLIHYSAMIKDAPIKLPNGKKWPYNYDRSYTSKNTLVGIALQKSLNTTAARLIEELTPELSYEYLTKVFGLTTLVESEKRGDQTFSDIDRSPLALGALTDGVTAREMTAAYAVFGSGGYYNEPYTFYKVTQGMGDDAITVLTGGQRSTKVMDEDSAYVMVSLMRRVVEQGTAWTGVGQNWRGWQVFGKTGTSDNQQDVYFSGGTPYFCASSWFGYDNNQRLASSQTGYAKTLWNASMQLLHEGLDSDAEFEQPDSVVRKKYCMTTGQLATKACKKTEMGVYKKSFMPGECEKCGKPDKTDKKPDADKDEDTDTTTSTTTPSGSTTQLLPTQTTGTTSNRDETDMVSVPNVSGMEEEDAVQKLEDAGFRVVVVDIASGEQPNGYAVKTNPEPLSRCRANSVITLFVSRSQTTASSDAPMTEAPTTTSSPTTTTSATSEPLMTEPTEMIYLEEPVSESN